MEMLLTSSSIKDTNFFRTKITWQQFFCVRFKILPKSHLRIKNRALLHWQNFVQICLAQSTQDRRVYGFIFMVDCKVVPLGNVKLITWLQVGTMNKCVTFSSETYKNAK